MTCSPERLAANRANALKSTGPRTSEGKQTSRANALKHGLCSSVVVAEDSELVLGRSREWFLALKPQNEYHQWLVDKIAVYTVRIDRAERMERRLRDRRSLGAEVAWDDDGRLDAEALGLGIAGRPAQVVEQLRKTPTGCDWLVSRWAMLAHAADGGKEWTADQSSLAFDLLGTPAEFREGHRPGDLVDAHGRVVDRGDDRVALARREVDRLLERRAEVADLDEVDRALNRVDLCDESNPGLKNLRRYEGTLHNRVRWCLAELRYVSPHFRPCPELMLRHVSNPNPDPAPAEADPAGAESSIPPRAAAALASVRAARGDQGRPYPYAPWAVDSPHPPFGLEAHERPADGSKPDLLRILLTRQEKRERKADHRREARRRKAERLRA